MSGSIDFNAGWDHGRIALIEALMTDEALRAYRAAYLTSPPHGVKHDDAARMEHERAGMRAALLAVGAIVPDAAEKVHAALASRVTHGRHCTCSACAREDWTNPALAACGMHGASCPAEYAPLGPAGSLVPASSERRES